jgi:Tol biopolymer transport system component
VYTVVGRSGVPQLYTLTLSAATQRPRPSPTLASDDPDDSDDDASWSPANDGTIVFTRTVPTAMTQLYVENVSDPQAASPLFSSPTGFDDFQPVYDPVDPGVIVFVRRMGSADHIMLVDVASGAVTDLSAQAGAAVSDEQPDFAPAGDPPRLVFQSQSAGTCGRTQLFTMALDGSDRIPVFSSTTAGNRCPDAGTDPAYAPQGDAIVFDREGRWGEQLYTAAVDGSGSATGSAQPVTRGVFLAGGPSWAPVDGPPTETPEAPWALGLPIAGVGASSALLAFRRRRVRTARRTVEEQLQPSPRAGTHSL